MSCGEHDAPLERRWISSPQNVGIVPSSAQTLMAGWFFS